MTETEKKAAQAATLLNDPLFKEACDKVEASLIAKAYGVDPLNVGAHTRIIDSLKALRLVKSALHAYIVDQQLTQVDDFVEPKRGVLASLRRLRD